MKLTWCWATKPHRSSKTTFVVCGRKVVNFINNHRGNPKMRQKLKTIIKSRRVKHYESLLRPYRPVTYEVSCITIHPKPLTSHTHPLSSPFRFHCWSTGLPLLPQWDQGQKGSPKESWQQRGRTYGRLLSQVTLTLSLITNMTLTQPNTDNRHTLTQMYLQESWVRWDDFCNKQRCNCSRVSTKKIWGMQFLSHRR